MANRQNTLLLKRSNVIGKLPPLSGLTLGEMALNTADAKLYTLYTSGSVTPSEVRQIGWDRISRTGDTVTGDFNFFGDISISGSSLPNGYALSVTGDTDFKSDVYVEGDIYFSGNVLTTGSTIIQNGLTANTIYTDYIDFNTGATVTQSPGRISWDSGTGTLNVAVGDSDTGLIDLQVGQEEIVRVFNSEATTLLKGEIVYVSGSQGNRPAVKRAIATSDGYSVTTLGMVDIDIDSGDEGYVTTFGIISNLNTLGLTGGTPVFLSPTVAGGFTSIKPQAPEHIVLIGYVVRVSATVGSIFINISNGWEIDELHDVRISAATEGDLLVRSSYSGTPVWVNTKTLPGNYTISGNTTHIGNFNITGNTNQIGNFTITGNTTQSGGTTQLGNVTLTGNSTQFGTYTHSGNTFVTGNTSQIGNFTITGNTTQSGDTTQLGNFHITGNTSQIGVYSHSGDTIITGNTTQLGDITLTGNTTQFGLYTHSGDTFITGNTTQIGNITLSGDSFITGNTTQIGNYHITGNTSQEGIYTHSGDTFITGNTTQIGDVTLSGDSFITGDTNQVGNFYLTGDTIIQSGITASTYNISSTPIENNTLFQILGRNETTGQVEYRQVNTIGNNVTIITGGTYSAQTTIDNVIGVDTTLTATTIYLPDSVSSGRLRFEIKDIGLNAYNNPITIIAAGTDTIISYTNSQTLIMESEGGAIILLNTGLGQWWQM